VRLLCITKLLVQWHAATLTKRLVPLMKGFCNPSTSIVVANSQYHSIMSTDVQSLLTARYPNELRGMTRPRTTTVSQHTAKSRTHHTKQLQTLSYVHFIALRASVRKQLCLKMSAVSTPIQAACLLSRVLTAVGDSACIHSITTGSCAVP
jgi:hypothetical protein